MRCLRLSTCFADFGKGRHKAALMTALTPMDELLFWLGIEAAQKGAGSKPTARAHWVVSLVVGILIALLITAGAFILLVSQQ
jgi:hypothetical protein